MAGLKQAVYDGKLIALRGAYRQHAPVLLLDGVGEAIASLFAQQGISTVGDLLRHEGQLPTRLTRIKQNNAPFLEGCVEAQAAR
jgi:predicted RecB family nuclease